MLWFHFFFFHIGDIPLGNIPVELHGFVWWTTKHVRHIDYVGHDPRIQISVEGDGAVKHVRHGTIQFA